MSNLIGTIIGIVLAVILGLAGIWYGGSIYMSAVSTAYANTLISQAQQIGSAWTFYVNTNNGGVYDGVTLSQLATPTSSLQQVPIPPGNVASTTPTWNLANLGNTASATGLNGIWLQLDNTDTANKVCLKLAQQGAGNSAALPTATTTSTTLVPASKRSFDCVFIPAAAETSPTVSDNKYFVYGVTAINPPYVTISSALYSPNDGATCTPLNVGPYIQSICNNQTSCAPYIGNSVGGDPCPGHHKQTNVSYSCYSTAKTAIIAENSSATLSCP